MRRERKGMGSKEEIWDVKGRNREGSEFEGKREKNNKKRKYRCS